MGKIWLIKKDHKIYGPMDQAELESMASSGFLSSKDEVTKSLRQWIFASRLEEPQLLFKKKSLLSSAVGTSSLKLLKDPSLLKTIKKKIAVRSLKKESQDISHFQQKDDSSEPVLKLESKKEIEDEWMIESMKSKDIPQLPVQLPLVTLAEQIPYDLEKEEKQEKSKSLLDYLSNQNVKSTKSSFKDVSNIRRQSKSKTNMIRNTLWLLLIVSVGGSAIVYYQFKQSEMVKKDRDLSSYLMAYRDVFLSGNYQEALSLLKSTPLHSSSLSSDYLNLSALLLQLEGNVYESKVALEKAKHQSDYNEERGLLLEGMIAYRENQIEEANILFDRALDVSQDTSLALLNKAILHIHTQKLDEASLILDRMDTTNNQTYADLILFLQAWLRLDSSSDLIQILIENPGEYSQEASFLSLYPSLKEEGVDAMTTIQQFLNQDPYLTSEYHHDILSIFPQVIWKDMLMKSCSQLYQTADQIPYYQVLYSFCQAQAGLLFEAQQNIETAFNQLPKDVFTLSVYSYILSQMGNKERSQFLLDRAMEYNKEPEWLLPLILQARFCEKQKDIQCSQKYWHQVSELKEGGLPATLNQALVLQSEGKTQEATLLIQDQLKQAPRYRPFQQFLSQPTISLKAGIHLN